ncbi:hypothetical protein Pelo_12649 [Pelomyxa schiedti]|nr:hypothetical protein Pelo_12649 [Pelomyxa schiedti]
MSANCSLLAGYMNQEEWNDARELQEAFVSNCQPNTSWEDLNHHLVHLDAIFKAKGIEQSEIDELMREVQYHFFDSCYDILVIPDGDDDNFRVAVRNGKDKALLSVSDDSWDYLQEFTRELEAISKARSPHMILRCVENAESVLAGYWRKFKSPTEPTPPEALAEWMELGLYQANILNMHSILNYLARFQEALPDHLQYLYRTLAGMVGVIEQRATGGRSYKYLGIGTRPCYATKYGVYANGKTTVHVEEDVNGFLVLRTSHDVS